jgi:EAL domain-containing protein (putative c-di-GMP-specific phosphodiesterase class I)
MKQTKNILDQFKNWIKQSVKVEQPKEISSMFKEQLINLDPIFDTQTNEFIGALQNDLIQNCPNIYLKRFQQGLDNISYWHFHGRAIKNLLPLPISFLRDKNFYHQLEQCIVESQLPVGLIKLIIVNYKKDQPYDFIEALLKLHRLGIILELGHFSAGATEHEWLNTRIFSGIHCSTHLIRAASMTSYSKEIFTDLMLTCKAKNLHTYSEGITLVHDFIFTKTHKIQFCYGPLLMPAVSKHQLLKIKTSLFNDSVTQHPKKKSDDGD